MRTVRASGSRGVTRAGWLYGRHSFSFGDYHDPAHMGFGPLRVINEDVVAPDAGFPMHGHRDMEIFTWILSGALEHRDSLGSGSVIAPGDAQLMRAGTGIRHSEFNPSPDTPAHLLQIWIEPEARGLPPAYGEKAFAPAALENRFAVLAAPQGQEGALEIRQDARILAARFASGAAEVPLDSGRRYWLQVARGAVEAGGISLAAGDALAVSGEAGVLAVSAGDAEVLLFDLP